VTTRVARAALIEKEIAASMTKQKNERKKKDVLRKIGR
jgi:hypothetical protein